MRRSRTLAWILGVAAAAGALLWLALRPGDADRTAPREPPPLAGEHAAPTAPAPALPPGETPGAEQHLDHLDDHADIDPAAGDLAATPGTADLPMPAEDDLSTRPERQPLTPEEQRSRRQTSIELLDRNIERLAAEQEAAEASGDTRTAERNRIRIERMRQRRATLAAEQAAGSAPP
jgi:hypothetical protein